MTNTETVTYVVFVVPAPGGVEAICPALECSAVAASTEAAIGALRLKMADAMAAHKAAGRAPPIESGYAVAQVMEDQLEQQSRSGLPLSMAAHEVTIEA